jgi:hypothetical protein
MAPIKSTTNSHKLKKNTHNKLTPINTISLIPPNLNLTCNYTHYNRYRTFLAEWIINGFNAQEAYKKVYPSVSNKVARVNGSRLLTNANVIEILTKEFNVENYVKKEFVVSKTVEILSNSKREDVKLKAVQYLGDMGGLVNSKKKELPFQANIQINFNKIGNELSNSNALVDFTTKLLSKNKES